MDPNIQAAPGAARVPPAPAGLGPGDLARITSAAADARAHHTRRTYAAQWARFAAWPAARGFPPRPAPPAAVAAYLTARATAATVATVRDSPPPVLACSSCHAQLIVQQGAQNRHDSQAQPRRKDGGC